MRVESSVTSLSWIPSEAVTGLNRAVFESGVAHYDDPPPDTIDDLDALHAADRFRFANRLEAWIDVEDGTIRAAGYGAGGIMGSTTIRLGGRNATFAAVALPELRAEPVLTGSSARFVQTYGGRTAIPAPRRVKHPPFVQFRAPLVWTTLALTIRADGTSESELVGASRFPRHWLYGADGTLEAKVGLADFKAWVQHSFGKHTPWGDEDSPAFITAVETALERELAGLIMRGGTKPEIRSLEQGALLTEQGSPGDEVFLLLDGVLAVEVDGTSLAEVGPGAILGERAVIEGGVRSSTLRATTKCRVAAVRGDRLHPDALAKVAEGHRRETRASE
jgi:hypothetical protein